MALYLRTVRPDGQSYFEAVRSRGFIWPVGPSSVGKTVTAPDWNPTPVKGGGLHGLKWGEGDYECLTDEPDTVWQVVFVPDGSEVGIPQEEFPVYDKYKFPSCTIVHSGTRESATQFIYKMAPIGVRVNYLKIHSDQTLNVIGGYCSDLRGGEYSVLVGFDYSTLEGGNHSTLTCGEQSTVKGGLRSSVITGPKSTVRGFYHSFISVGSRSTVRVGEYCDIQGGNGSIITADVMSTIRWRYPRIGAVLTSKTYTTGDNIKEDHPYQGEFVDSFWRSDRVFKLKKL